MADPIELGGVVITVGIFLAAYAACSNAVGSCIVAIRKWELDGAQRAIERRRQREQRQLTLPGNVSTPSVLAAWRTSRWSTPA
jgi:hypothetical protein